MGKKQVAQKAIIGHSPFDRAIIAGFSMNKSAEEISRSAPINGTMTPAQCLYRITQLQDSKDALDAHYKKLLIIDTVYEMSGKLKKQIDDAEYIDKDSATTFLKTQKELLAMVEKANGDLTDELMAFNRQRADEFTSALGYIFDRLLNQLREKYPEIELEEAQEIVMEAIPAALPEVK
jgi:hypothetical protein